MNSTDRDLIIAECKRLAELLKKYDHAKQFWQPNKERAEIARTAKSLRINTVRLEKQLYNR